MALIWRVLETVDYSLMRLTGRLPKPAGRLRSDANSKRAAESPLDDAAPTQRTPEVEEEPDPAGWD
jgi:hypothetical protein